MSTDVRELLELASLPPGRALDVDDVMRSARHRVRRRRAVLVGAPVLAVLAVVGAAGSSSLLSGPSTRPIETHTPPDTAGPTKGTMPLVPQTRADGSQDPTRLPDFIATLDRNGNRVGYVERKVMEDPLTGLDPIPVYGEDLREIVGHMYSGRGFVALDQDPSTVPEITSTTVVGTVPPATEPGG